MLWGNTAECHTITVVTQLSTLINAESTMQLPGMPAPPRLKSGVWSAANCLRSGLQVYDYVTSADHAVWMMQMMQTQSDSIAELQTQKRSGAIRSVMLNLITYYIVGPILTVICVRHSPVTSYMYHCPSVKNTSLGYINSIKRSYIAAPQDGKFKNYI